MSIGGLSRGERGWVMLGGMMPRFWDIEGGFGIDFMVLSNSTTTESSSESDSYRSSRGGMSTLESSSDTPALSWFLRRRGGISSSSDSSSRGFTWFEDGGSILVLFPNMLRAVGNRNGANIGGSYASGLLFWEDFGVGIIMGEIPRSPHLSSYAVAFVHKVQYVAYLDFTGGGTVLLGT